MNFFRDIPKALIEGVAYAQHRKDLECFKDPDCAAAVWDRQLQPSFQAWLDGLSPDQLPKGRIVLPRNAVAGAVEQLCAIAGTPECEDREYLVNDVTALSEMFADLMNASYLRLRLDVITTNACRKFHLDAVKARLVCTYLGTGTQYGTSGEGTDPTTIDTTPTGAPILLRGSLWPTSPKAHLKHRSPPIEGTGETRLVLVLDPLTQPDGED
ncbi:MAG: DUF1826 domain-containing protein [Pseudomonadota bacterium]